MKLIEVLPIITEEYNYDYSYAYTKDSNIEQQANMHPFVYDMPMKGFKRLILIWELILDDKNISANILTLKVECGYILDCRIKSKHGLNHFKKLLEISFGYFSLYYQYLMIGHSVKLKNLEQYYQNLEHHFQGLSPLLYGDHQ